jgi:nicotinamide mononucleotide transporter
MDTHSIQQQIIAAWQAMSGWEMLAATLALSYVLLAMKERIECWYAAFLSTTIYIFLFWDVNLLMASALQLYYMLMALYGWRQWRRHKNQQQDLLIHRWPLRNHLIVVVFVAIMVSVSGYLLTEHTSAVLPYLDSFASWTAVVTTFMVTRKVLENWLYWLVIDTVSVYIYIDRELYLTAILFSLYLIIGVFGFREWSKRLREQSA